MTMTNLMIHCGGHQVSEEKLNAVATPEATDTWFPIPHNELLDSVRRNVGAADLRIVQEQHALARDDAHYFGLLQVANGKEADDYTTIIGLRNAHDKRFPAGLVVGSQVFICDNLAFSGEVNIARKHTRFIMRDLAQLIERAMGQLVSLRTTQDQRLAAYKDTGMTDAQANDLLIRAMDARVCPVTKLPKVLEEWRRPSHPEFAEGRNAWRMFNAFTEVLKGTNVFQLPKQTQALHGLIDTHCGLAVAN
jgi:hypothetical protein